VLCLYDGFIASFRLRDSANPESIIPLFSMAFAPLSMDFGLAQKVAPQWSFKNSQMPQSLSPHETSIRDAIARLCAPFDDAYWLAKDRGGGFPEDFFQAFAKAGWLGICIPQAYGGTQLGITEAAIMMQAVAQSGAGLSGSSALHMNIFGLNPVVK